MRTQADALPRLLFLSPVVPAPLDRGQNVRIHHLIEGLAGAFRVTVVLPQNAEDFPASGAVEQVVAVPPAVARLSPGEFLRFLVRHRTLARPSVVRRLLPYRRAIDRLPLDDYAAIWVARSALAGLVAGQAGRVVVDLDDLEHRNWVRELRLHAGGGIGRPLLRRLVNATRSFVREIVLVRRFRCCTVASTADVAYLRRWRVRNGALLPNGAAVGDIGSPGRQDAATAPRLVFVGNLDYEPNVDALVHFEDDIRPALDRLGVAVDLEVVGPGVTDDLITRFPRVTFRGFAPDLPAALQRSALSVAPLRLGGGTKVKLLDAMAAGLPVVATSVGAEGLDLTDGIHLLVADSPPDFAAAVARLLADASLAASIADSGRRLVAERYSWASVQRRAVALATAAADACSLTRQGEGSSTNRLSRRFALTYSAGSEPDCGGPSVSDRNPVSITVLTPTYQSGGFLPTALASVAGPRIQHVVMDGGSSDGTVDLLEAAPSVVWRSEPDRGQSHALNKAIREADGEWIGWLNADEFYLPGVLDWVRERLTSGDVDVLFGDFAEVDTDGRLLRLVTNHRFSPTVLRHGSCYLPSCATFVRRELVERVGGWREERRMMMDWDLWLRLLDAGARIGYEPVVVSGFARHDEQVTALQAGRWSVERAEMNADLGIENPPWRHYLARAYRIAMKTVNGSYLREIRSRSLRGTRLTGPDSAEVCARINPSVPIVSPPPG